MIVFISKIEILSIRTFHFGIIIAAFMRPLSRRRPKSHHRTAIIGLNFSRELSACGGSDMTRKLLRMGQGLILAGCAVLSACASNEHSKTLQQVDATEIAAAAGCSRDEVAVCIEIDCQPEEYRCAPRADVLGLFKARDFRH